jgi:GDPmannose 4,6-dehydratase
MHRMLQQEQPEDLVIATGRTHSLEKFVAAAFSAVGLRWRPYVRHDERLVRPTELTCGRADPARAREKLGWQARYQMPDVARMMVEARLARASHEIRHAV